MPVFYNLNNAISPQPVNIVALATAVRSTVVAAPDVINPVGTTTDVAEFRTDTTLGTHYIQIPIPAAATWVSFYIKMVPTNPAASVGISNTTFGGDRWFTDAFPNIANPFPPGSNVLSASLIQAANGWFRMVSNVSTPSTHLIASIGNLVGTASFLPANNEGIYLWGAFAHTANENYFFDTGTGLERKPGRFFLFNNSQPTFLF